MSSSDGYVPVVIRTNETGIETRPESSACLNLVVIGPAVVIGPYVRAGSDVALTHDQ